MDYQNGKIYTIRSPPEPAMPEPAMPEPAMTKMEYLFKEKAQMHIADELHALEEGVNWIWKNNDGYLYGIYTVKCGWIYENGMNIEQYGAYIERQIILYLIKNYLKNELTKPQPAMPETAMPEPAITKMEYLFKEKAHMYIADDIDALEEGVNWIEKNNDAYLYGIYTVKCGWIYENGMNIEQYGAYIEKQIILYLIETFPNDELPLSYYDNWRSYFSR